MKPKAEEAPKKKKPEPKEEFQADETFLKVMLDMGFVE